MVAYTTNGKGDKVKNPASAPKKEEKKEDKKSKK